MRYMLDTNICIYAIKHKPKQAFLKLQEHAKSLGYTIVTNNTREFIRVNRLSDSACRHLPLP